MEYIFSNLSAQGTLGFHGAPLGESALPYLLTVYPFVTTWILSYKKL